MAEPFVELGAEGVNYITEKHWDKIHDTVGGGINKVRRSLPGGKNNDRNNYDNDPRDSGQPRSERYRPGYAPEPSAVGYNTAGATGAASAVSGNTRASNRQRKHYNQLPSPEGNVDENYRYDRRRRASSLDRESEFSEQVISAYEQERDDPRRKPESVLSKKDLRRLRRDSKMSYANGYGGNLSTHPQNAQRASSAQPPRTKYYDDDDEYGSDYDDRTGRRYRTTGRGYDDEGYDDRGYDREIIETERYRGPARADLDRRQSYGTQRSAGNDPYGAGAVTQYRRSTQDVDRYSRRSDSRGRRDKYRDDRDRSRSSSRSRSGSRERGGWRGRVDEYFDTSMQGLGVGIAGAVVGGMAGRHFGHDPRHRNRDILLGALAGGLGANAAENKWRDYSDKEKDKLRGEEDRLEQRWDGRDYGRSRSAMR